MSNRDDWKQAGTGLGHAFRDLGKAFGGIGKTVIKTANNWANSDDDAPVQEGTTTARVVVDAEVVVETRTEE